MSGAGLDLLAQAFLWSAIGTFLMRRAGIVDAPNHRSSHTAPTPRGGGLGVLLGVYVATAIYAIWPGGDSVALASVLMGSLAAGALGLADDIRTVDERLKLIILFAISLALAIAAGPVTELGFPIPFWVGVAGSTLWIFTVTNAVNFMDGSDGLLAASLIPASLGLAVMSSGEVQAVALFLAAALAGFAIFNAPILKQRGTIFCGDVGSLGIAVLFADLAVTHAYHTREGTAWLMALLLLPLLGDVLLTLLARARAGRNVFQPHRSHAYQLLIRMGWSHKRVAMVWGGLAFACWLAAWSASVHPASVKASVFAGAVILFAIFHAWVRGEAASKGVETTE